MRSHHFLTFAMAAFLTWNYAGASPLVLGVVLEAERAHVNTTSVTDGATVYDGDRFSTEAGGKLSVQGHAAVLELTEQSVVTMHGGASGARGTEAELGQGTLVFHAERSTALEVVAREARIRPASDARTIGQVSVFGLTELRVYARRGPLQISYRGETETIAEGESYRIILDPSNGDAKQKGAVKSARERKTFLLIAITGGVAGAATAAALQQNHGHKKMESPDRP